MSLIDLIGYVCQVCHKDIEMMIFKGTRYCCENCRKFGEGERCLTDANMISFQMNVQIV